MEHDLRCPNCGRNPTDTEIYCYFCELGIETLKNQKFLGHRTSFGFSIDLTGLRKKDLSKKQH